MCLVSWGDEAPHQHHFISRGCTHAIQFDADVRKFPSTSHATRIQRHDAQMSEAIRNVKFGFTLIGLTNELPTTAKMVGKVFPWMAEADPWANPEDTTSTVTTTTVTTTTITSGTTKHNYKRSPPHGNTECPLPHSNASPQNNRYVELYVGREVCHNAVRERLSSQFLFFLYPFFPFPFESV